jgi:hypothetical protein
MSLVIAKVEYIQESVYDLSWLSAAGLDIDISWFMEDPLSGQRFLGTARKFVTSSIMEEYVTVPKREKG